jgi:hypothetical protein
VIPDKNRILVGNGKSDNKVFDTSSNPPTFVVDINTGSKNRVDEMDYDHKENVVVATRGNDASVWCEDCSFHASSLGPQICAISGESVPGVQASIERQLVTEMRST